MICWKLVQGRSDKNKLFFLEPSLPTDDSVLVEIQNMPPGKQVSVELANFLFWQEVQDNWDMDDNLKAAQMINNGLLYWLAQNDYQIVLRGDEYEIAAAA